MIRMAHKPGLKFPENWLQPVLAALIILCGFAIRLYDLDDPPLDFHASRQLRSAIITRAFYYEALEGTSGPLAVRAAELAELERYEPPIMERVVAKMDQFFGREVFWTGRIFSSFFWALGGIFVFLICRQIASAATGLVSLLLYFFLPFSVIASRSFQPDPWMCAWVVFTAWLIIRWTDSGSWKAAALAGVAGGAAILIKAFAGFFVGAMLIGACLAAMERKNWQRWLFQAVVAGVLMVVPSLIYYLGLNPGRSSDFFSFWVVSLSGIIRTPRFYASWIAMLKGLTGLILPILAIWGAFLVERRPIRGMLIGWWVGYGLYGLVVPYQIMTHEYYSLILIPLIAVSISPLLKILIEKTVQSGRKTVVAVGLLLGLAAAYGGYASCGTLRGSDYRLEPVSWQRIGENLPEDEPFAALTADYGMRLIYYGWRMPALSWPDSSDQALFEMAGRTQEDFSSYFTAQTTGKSFFLVTAFGELEAQPELAEKLAGYPIYASGNGYTIFDLRESN